MQTLINKHNINNKTIGCQLGESQRNPVSAQAFPMSARGIDPLRRPMRFSPNSTTKTARIKLLE